MIDIFAFYALTFIRAEKFVEEGVQIFMGLMKACAKLDWTCSLTNSLVPDTLAIALTGADLSLVPMLIRVMISGLVFPPGMGEAYAATDDNNVLVGYLVFSLLGQLLFAT